MSIRILLLVIFPLSLFADVEPSTASEEFVTSIHEAELAGDNSGRSEQLEAAMELNSKDPTIRWQAGLVRLDRKWVDVEDVDPSERELKRWQVYVDQRNRAPDTVAGQLELANWCRRHHLPMQERSHLQRVIEFAPDHEEARQRLGYVARGSRWVEAQSIWENERDAQQIQRAERTWRPKILEIANKLSDTHPRPVASARKRLAEMDDPDTVYAIEAVMGYGSDELARIAIEKIAEFSQHEASMALTRIAITSASPLSRTLAAQELGSRRLDDFVPALLNELSKPIESTFVAMERNGQVQYRHAFAREQRSQKDMDIRDLALRPESSTVRGGDPSTSIQIATPRPTTGVDAQSRSRAIARVMGTMLDRELEKEGRNARISELNSRITTTLALATHQKQNDDPEYWWSWWDQENDVYESGPKRERTYYVNSSETYQTTPTLQATSPSSPSVRHECFVAGTPVLTWQGAIPIDKIRRGDIVISQDPETGELAFQPVLSTTVRPIDDILCITTTDDEVHSSPGHPLWVSGEGWKLAKQLSKGDVIHGLRGGYRVLAAEPADKQVSYNLVIDRFHTYFVGQTNVLVHDNTEVRATNAKFPGH